MSTLSSSKTTGQDTLGVRRTLRVSGKDYDYFSLPEAQAKIGDVSRLPYCLKVLLENLLRYEDGCSVCIDDLKAFPEWQQTQNTRKEIAYRPARVLMQDFTGVPAVCDLASMREAVVKMGGDGDQINPLSEVDLVIDHSVMVDHFGNEHAFQLNVEREFERNQERYKFLRWGQSAFRNFRVVPPGTGICHQVNLEHLAQTVWVRDDEGRAVAFPDTVVGTDSHTTMINGLAVLGWGVGGIEAEAAMLGQPVSMLIPEVIGFRLTGKLPEGTTATDLVLRVTEMLRAKGVVGKFVEFYGSGLRSMSLADRATISNMAPEYGATCGFFPIDAETLAYLRFSGREEERIALVEAYAKAQGMWREETSPDPVFTDVLELDLGCVEPALAGPKRPQDRVLLKAADASIRSAMADQKVVNETLRVPVEGLESGLGHGDVVIAAITSCTNTSNPSVMIAAGLVAKKARERGLTTKPWVKTSLAPGSQVVTDYLKAAHLQEDLDALGFNLVGYGCTTCIGNSGPLSDPIIAAIEDNNLVTAAVLSGNRNFEGRVSPQTRANYLASPPLVVAYAIAGNMTLNLTCDPIGQDPDGTDVYLKDIWPSSAEISETLGQALTRDMFRERYANVFKGGAEWQAMDIGESAQAYHWEDASTYIANPPYFDGMEMEPVPITDIQGARLLALLGDSITTDHISPAGAIKSGTPAADWLNERQVRRQDFNSYGSRRGHHDVMARGTFANIRLRNEVLDAVEGGYTKYFDAHNNGVQMSIHEASERYRAEERPLIIIGGKEYGTGSSRDWAAKGTRLLGVRAVIAESFERIHRSNLVGMGVLPLTFPEGVTRKTLGLTGAEMFDITGDGLSTGDTLTPQQELTLTVSYPDGRREDVGLLMRLDTLDEVNYYSHGGILHYVLRNMLRTA